MATTLAEMRAQIEDTIDDSENHSSAVDKAIWQTIRWLETSYNLDSMKVRNYYVPSADGKVYFPGSMKEYEQVLIWDPDDWVQETRGRARATLGYRRPEEVGFDHYKGEVANSSEIVGIPALFSEVAIERLESLNVPASWADTRLQNTKDFWRIQTYPRPEENYIYEFRGWAYTLRDNLKDAMIHPLFEEANEIIEAGALVRLARRLIDPSIRQMAKQDLLDIIPPFLAAQDSNDWSDTYGGSFEYNGENTGDNSILDYYPNRTSDVTP